MAKAWRVIGTIALILLVLGAVCIGVGLLTGGSVQRMLESYFGSAEAFEFMKQSLTDTINEAINSVK